MGVAVSPAELHLKVHEQTALYTTLTLSLQEEVRQDSCLGKHCHSDRRDSAQSPLSLEVTPLAAIEDVEGGDCGHVADHDIELSTKSGTRRVECRALPLAQPPLFNSPLLLIAQ